LLICISHVSQRCTLYTCTLCTVYFVHGVLCARCTLCTVYFVHGVLCTRCTLYTVYFVHLLLLLLLLFSPPLLTLSAWGLGVVVSGVFFVLLQPLTLSAFRLAFLHCLLAGGVICSSCSCSLWHCQLAGLRLMLRLCSFSCGLRACSCESLWHCQLALALPRKCSACACCCVCGYALSLFAHSSSCAAASVCVALPTFTAAYACIAVDFDTVSLKGSCACLRRSALPARIVLRSQWPACSIDFGTVSLARGRACIIPLCPPESPCLRRDVMLLMSSALYSMLLSGVRQWNSYVRACVFLDVLSCRCCISSTLAVTGAASVENGVCSAIAWVSPRYIYIYIYMYIFIFIDLYVYIC